MANIQQVAAEAGVSVATVSRYINKPDTVAPKTRVKVKEAIQKLNYEPSSLGRNLRKSESRLFIVLIPSISNPFYFEIIKGIETEALKKQYNIMLCETASDPEREEIYFELVRTRMADGIISMDPAVNIKTLQEMSDRYAIVQCSEYSIDTDIAYVSIDSVSAAYQAVKHLINIGNKKIALINSDKSFLYARQREEGYLKALEEYNITKNDDYIYYTDELDFQAGERAMRAILNNEERPTAVFAVSDVLAIGALKTIQAYGLKVPDDIAVVGFDKISFSNMTNPTLTTISQPMYEMGRTAAKMLLDKIKGEEIESVILDHELVIRESTLV